MLSAAGRPGRCDTRRAGATRRPWRRSWCRCRAAHSARPRLGRASGPPEGRRAHRGGEQRRGPASRSAGTVQMGRPWPRRGARPHGRPIAFRRLVLGRSRPRRRRPSRGAGTTAGRCRHTTLPREHRVRGGASGAAAASHGYRGGSRLPMISKTASASALIGVNAGRASKPDGPPRPRRSGRGTMTCSDGRCGRRKRHPRCRRMHRRSAGAWNLPLGRPSAQRRLPTQLHSRRGSMRHALAVLAFALAACGSTGDPAGPGEARPREEIRPGPRPPALCRASAGARSFPADNAWNRDVSGDPVHPNSAALLAQMVPDNSIHLDLGTTRGVLRHPVHRGAGGPASGPHHLRHRRGRLLRRERSGADADSARRAHRGRQHRGARPRIGRSPRARRAPGGLPALRAVQHRPHRIGIPGELLGGVGPHHQPHPACGLDLRRCGGTADPAGLAQVREKSRPTGCITRSGSPFPRCAAPIPRPRVTAASTADDALPPYGTRVRLKASFSLDDYSGDALVILTAMKRYGLILADQGSAWYVTGTTNPAGRMRSISCGSSGCGEVTSRCSRQVPSPPAESWRTTASSMLAGPLEARGPAAGRRR